MLRKLIAIVGCAYCIVIGARAQSPDAPQDSATAKRAFIPGGLNIVLSKSFFLPFDKVDSVPLRTRSGAFCAGVSIKAPIRSPRWGLRFTPAVSWLTYDYKQAGKKRFPSSDTTNIIERQRFVYVQAQLSAFLNITIDEKQKPLIWVEGGITPMYLLSSAYVVKLNNTSNQVVATKVSGLLDTQPLAMNMFGRVGYKSVALEWQMHTQPFLTSGLVGAISYPRLQHIQAGIVLQL